MQATAGLAIAALQQGRWNDAVKLFRQALGGLGGSPPERQLAAALQLDLGVAHLQCGATAEAAAAFGRARDAFTQLGDQLGVAEAMHDGGLAQLCAGQAAESVRLLRAAREAAKVATMRRDLESLDPGGTPGPSAAGTRPAGVPGSGGVRNQLLPDELQMATPRPVQGAVRLQPSADELTAGIGTSDLRLRLRPVSPSGIADSLPLETATEVRHSEYERELRMSLDGSLVTIRWRAHEAPGREELAGRVLHARTELSDPKQLGLRLDGAAQLAAQLSLLYDFALPVKMADCYHYLGDFEKAENEYLRAARWEHVNLAVEAPDLWRRIAANVLAWGDSRYRGGDALAATTAYEKVILVGGQAPQTALYALPSLAPTGAAVTAWLAALVAATAPPALNPALSAVLLGIRSRLRSIDAGLDFFGHDLSTVPPFTFSYLSDVAHFLATQAIQREQRFIDFSARYESGQLTRTDLENAAELAGLEVAAAQERQQEAAAMLDAAGTSVKLSDERARNADDLLAEFKSQEAEQKSMIDLADSLSAAHIRPFADIPSGWWTRRMLQLSNELQQMRMEQNVDELKLGAQLSRDQQRQAQARKDTAGTETKIAQAREAHANEMLLVYDSQSFDADQWHAMAVFMRALARTALDRAIEVARLMEQAYNFENAAGHHAIRPSYSVASTAGLLAGELLASDIEGFTHHRTTTVRAKPVPVTWPVSLAERFPAQLERLRRTGTAQLDILPDEVTLAFPGTCRQQLAAVELEVDGFVPPEGLHGRLSASGLGRHRAEDGTWRRRLQPAETLVLSRYDRSRDALAFTPEPGMRALFEGNAAASGWTIELPRSANDMDLRSILDVRLVLHFECLFSRQLFAADVAAAPAGAHAASRALDVRYGFPDAYFSLRETGTAEFTLGAEDFPWNQETPQLTAAALAFAAEPGTSLAGAHVTVELPGLGPADVTVGPGDTVLRAALPIGGHPSALGEYRVTLPDTVRRDSVADLVLVLDYVFTPAS